MQEIIRSVEARLRDEATVTELDLRLEDWASAELKSVAADFYHELIDSLVSRKSVENCPYPQRRRRI